MGANVTVVIEEQYDKLLEKIVSIESRKVDRHFDEKKACVEFLIIQEAKRMEILD